MVWGLRREEGSVEGFRREEGRGGRDGGYGEKRFGQRG